jgi:hypothetical protein
MSPFSRLALCFCAVSGLALLSGRDAGSRVQYIGGTVSSLSAKSGGMLDIGDGDELQFAAHGTVVRVPYHDVNLIEYGQRVNRRYVEAVLISPLLLLSKKRSHFVTVGYSDHDGRQQAMVFQVSGGDVRSVLVGLEARTGRKVEYQDDEARKSGKG